MPEHPLLILAPYGRRLWSEVLDRLDNPADITIGELGQDENLTQMANRVLAGAPPRFALVGFCMGGYLAFEIYRLAAERVSKLALINTGPMQDSPRQREVRTDRIAKLRAKSQQMTYPDGTYVEHAAQWLLSSASYKCPDIARQTRALLGEIPLLTSASQQLAMLNRCDSRPLLPYISVPTLIIGGHEDRVIPSQQAVEMARVIPGARAHIIRNCGHLAPAEAPCVVADLMAAWLKLASKDWDFGGSEQNGRAK